jgi:hypothetical protein
MAYGGLKFDVSLLKCACLQWQQRFAAHQTAAAAVAAAAAIANSTATQSSSTPSRQAAAASAQATKPEPAATSTTSTAGVSVVDSSQSTCSSRSAAVPAVDDAVLRTAGCEPFSYMSAAARAALYDTSTPTPTAAAAVTAVTASASSPWLLLLGRLHSNCGIDSALLSEVLQHVHSSAAVSAADGTTAASGTISSATTSSSSSNSSDAVQGFQSAAHVKQQQQQQQQQPLQPLLREEHTHVAGIDFHVSNVLQDALRAPGAAAAVRRALCMSSGDDGALQDAMRSAMWRFSSGVNVRTPLIASTSSSSSSDDADSGGYSEQQLAAAWAVVKEPVQAAALHTIRSRLAS